MGQQDMTGGVFNVTRRGFLKTAAAVGSMGGALDFFYDPAKALAYEDDPAYNVTTTTCPYCSASCGQRVVTDMSGNVVDVYGDFESPMNSGGLCSKGAGAYQLVTNTRRLGAWAGAHPTGVAAFAYDPAYTDGVAYKRVGNGAWGKVTLAQALKEIASGDASGNQAGLKGIRNAAGVDASGNFVGVWDASGNEPRYNSKTVAFLGSSHMNNESCYLYRKIIANFGSSNVEHQARI